MKKEMDLCQVVYNNLATQIRFGAYRFGDQLPTLEELSHLQMVSIDTVRTAYRRLQADGFITLSKSTGATVKVQYTEAEIAQNIQKFYSQRKDSLLDLSQSMRFLFCNALWTALKHAPPEILDEIDLLVLQNRDILPSYTQHLQLIYGSLHNELMMRLVWQTFMFFQAPFLSISDNVTRLIAESNPLLDLTGCCRRKDWAGLWSAVEAFFEKFSCALSGFYEEKISLPPTEKQVTFIWSSYKKTSQICYSLCREILGSISRHEYPAGSYLPSLEKLAKEKQVSVSTIRRTLLVLNQIGAVKSLNGVGTKILPLGDNTENCDFTQPVIRKRLLDYVQCLQFFALSCRMTAESTLASLDSEAFAECKNRLLKIKQTGQPELVVYLSLEFIACSTPLRTIRTVYTELLHLLFWGNPLRSIRKNQEGFSGFFLPYIEYFIACLDRPAPVAFAATLEELVTCLLNLSVELMAELGFSEVESLLIPSNSKA